MTNAELAILSLIAEQPRHGYEIEQVIQERGMRQWTEMGFSSIYYLLKKLQDKGYVKGRPGQNSGRGPAPTVYQLTSDGKQAWQEAVLEALSVPRPCHTPIQLGLANLNYFPAEEVVASLRQYQEKLAQRMDQVQEQAQKQRPLPDHIETLFDYSLTMMGAELSWTKQLIERMESQNV
jgi:DNA-binding PadR family transcriptional regulator